jgi:hypothetical protein
VNAASASAKSSDEASAPPVLELIVPPGYTLRIFDSVAADVLRAVLAAMGSWRGQ